MNLTISLDEPAAEQLRQQASARQLSPEQVAVTCSATSSATSPKSRGGGRRTPAAST